MSKINVDIDSIKNNLEKIGYVINECIEKDNNGKNWQIKFSNSGAIANIYDSNNTKNTVVNGKPEENEKEVLKKIIDGLKCEVLVIEDLNRQVVDLINAKKEDYYCDYKEMFHKNNGDLIHDILCLSNNIENRDAYLIYGVSDDNEVVGINERLSSNNIINIIKNAKFAGDNIPDIEVKNYYYKYKTIGVIVCKSSNKVPFFLREKYKQVLSGLIYTRVGDTNTPINECASYHDIEKLWSIHFNKE